MYNTKPRAIKASELRDDVAAIAEAEEGESFLVSKHGQPRVLLIPVPMIHSQPDKRRLMLQAVTAWNNLDTLPMIEEMPDVPPMVSQTQLRRAITEFFQRIARSPIPGLITHYDQVVGLYVPMASGLGARQFLAEFNKIRG